MSANSSSIPNPRAAVPAKAIGALMRNLQCATAATAIILLPGCGSDKNPAAKLPPKPAAQQVEWENHPLVNAPTTRLSTPVKQGIAPLIYMVEGPGVARVVDLMTGRTLAEANVAAGTIISVTAEAGVTVGRAKFVRGPLELGRQYVVYLDTGDGSESRTGSLRATGKDPRPEEQREQNAPPPRPVGP